ncbi:MAG: prolyl-tRNA synthetase associated domain-containing protein [Candidatus Heimdallarchaeota archaeon]|nr:prolyl-tRNA synthetase associated domain-containing protein [Candidatus Heimdallarchaeota archaeon]
MDSTLKDWLDCKNINYKLHIHPAVFTVEEAKKHCSFIPGLHCKNLFLKEKTGDKRYFLVTLPSDKKLEFRTLEMLLNSSKLTFAKEEELQKILGLSTGAVSALGLINDTENEVVFVVDREVWDAEIVSFHPNINTETLEFKQEFFHKIIHETENQFYVI